jgi:CheY-like chemotaxis protein
MDGFEATRRIQEKFADSKAPTILAVTALSKQDVYEVLIILLSVILTPTRTA